MAYFVFKQPRELFSCASKPTHFFRIVLFSEKYTPQSLELFKARTKEATKRTTYVFRTCALIKSFLKES